MPISVRSLPSNLPDEELQRAIDVLNISFGGTPLDDAFHGYDPALARPGMQGLLQGTLLEGCGAVFVASEEEGGIDSVAILFGPGQWAGRTEEQRAITERLSGSKLSEKAKKWFSEELGPTMNALEERCFGPNASERAHASYDLCFLGTHPDKQKRGLGSALVKTIMKKAEEEGVEAMLKTHSQENVDFYSRLGYAVASEPVTLNFEGGSTPYWLLTDNSKAVSS